MPMVKLPIRPGVNTQASKLLNSGGWAISSCIRFLNGLLQKLGGCTRLTSNTFLGTARALHGFQDLTSLDYIAIGTNLALEIELNGSIYSITPIGRTYNAANVFSTTSGDDLVTISDSSASVVAGDYVNIVTAVDVGGIFLQGAYPVQSNIPATSYTILATSQATGSVTSGGAIAEYFTTSGSSTVAVSLGSYVFVNQQNYTVGVSTPVGGLTLSGPYVMTVTGGNASITASGAATSTTSAFENSNQARIVYPLVLPPENPVTGAYGVGPYGEGPYGIGTGSTGPVALVNWSLDNWGQILVAAYPGSEVYEWTPPVAPGNYATQISGSPSVVNGIFVSTTQQILVAWGAYSSAEGAQDPLLIAWSDVSNFNTWTPSATNQAGSFRIPNGSRIISMLATYGQNLVWTDFELWSMQYLGFPLVFGFNKVGEGCGLISQNSVAPLGSNIMWMSQKNFFMYSGGQITPVPCSVWDFIWNNRYGPPLDTTYVNAIVAAANSYFNEITWFFPQVGSNGVCTAYVKYNLVSNSWDFGQDPAFQRSAWIDQSAGGSEIGADYNGLLQQQETAIDFDGVTVDSYAETGFFEIAEGGRYMFVERIIPDVVFNTTPFMGSTNTGSNVVSGVPFNMGIPVVGAYVAGPGVPYNTTITATNQTAGTITLSAPVSQQNTNATFRSSPAVITMTFKLVNYPNDAPTVYGPYQVNISTKYLVVRGRGRLMAMRIETTSSNTFFRYGENLAVAAPAGSR